MSILWDAHCHLSDGRFFSERLRILQRALNQGIGGFFIGGYEPVEWDRQLLLKEEFVGQAEVRTSFGLHPWWISQADRTDEELESGFQKLSQKVEEADALGETGLDFQVRFSEKAQKLQRVYFERSLALKAQIEKRDSRNVPLVLHIVRAHPETLGILKAADLGKIPGLIHSFSGDWRAAKGYLDLGFVISISGALLRAGGERLHETVQKVPLDRLTLETDSPDQAPMGFQSEVVPGFNDPSSLIGLAQAVAQIRGEDSQKVLEASSANVIKLFA